MQLVTPPLDDVPRYLGCKRRRLEVGLESKIGRRAAQQLIGNRQDQRKDWLVPTHLIGPAVTPRDNAWVIGCDQRQVGETVRLVEQKSLPLLERRSAAEVVELVVTAEGDHLRQPD